MKYKKFLVLFLVIPFYSFSQVTGVVLDSGTKQTVPYINIWVDGENIGTTSNDKGEFVLEKADTSKTIVLSAIGYETKKVKINSFKPIVLLNPKTTELKEVVISSKKELKELSIGFFDKSKINHYFGCGSSPWITARYFPYEGHYEATSFIKKITFVTNSDIKNARFIIRLYSIGENGEPGDYIYDKNIYGIAKKGKKLTEVDCSDLYIQMPKTGLFIAVEWLIIEENKYEYTYTFVGSKKKIDGLSYEPSFGTVPKDTGENSWIYSKGAWRKVWKNNASALSRYSDKYSLLAIELILSN